jgi:hypothetical protein
LEIGDTAAIQQVGNLRYANNSIRGFWPGACPSLRASQFGWPRYLRRIAGFQPANRTTFRRSADWKSAIQQVGNLRYQGRSGALMVGNLRYF